MIRLELVKTSKPDTPFDCELESMTSAVHVPMPMRDDVVTEGGDPEVVLSNSPKRAGAFFVVPKVVE